MSNKRIISRFNSIAMRRLWNSRGVQFDRSYIADKSMPTDEGQLMTIPIPVGYDIDEARFYMYHDIFGQVDFNNTDALRDFPTSSKGVLLIDPEISTMVSKGGVLPADNRPEVFYHPYGMEDPWDQPIDNTPVEIRVPYFDTVAALPSPALGVLHVRYNWGGDKGGGLNYIRLLVNEHSSDPDWIQINLDAINYGVVQAGGAVYAGWKRNPPNPSGDLIPYRFQFWLNPSDNRAYLKIIPEYSGASESTISVEPPPGLAYCSIHRWQLYEMWNEPTIAQTGVTLWRILKAAGATRRIEYNLIKEGNPAGMPCNGDYEVESGYASYLFSSLGPTPGDTVTLTARVKWPAIVKGLGLAWEGG